MNEEIDSGASGADETEDLRSTIANAMREHEDTPAPAENAPAEKSAVERARDAAGKFAKAESESSAQAPPAAAAASSESATRVAEAPATGAQAPSSWKTETKAAWSSLPPAIQGEILKREADFERGYAKHAEKARIGDAIERAAAPFAETFRELNLHPIDAAARMWRVEQMLRKDPVGTLRQIAQAYKVDPGALLQQQGRSAVPEQSQPDPRDARIARLELEAQRRAQAEEHARISSAEGEISEFRKNAPHFEAVEDRMVALIQSGYATELKQAYEAACWMDPNIRADLIAEQSRPLQTAAQAQANKAKVDRAKAAASSVTGAPAGTRAASKTSGDEPLRDTIKAAMRELA